MIDYMVMEAIAVRVAQEDREATEKAKVTEWKKDPEGLEELKKVAQ